MVAISYDRGVVMCEQYDSMSGTRFAKMMDNCLPQALALSIKPDGNLFLQDGDPSQNSATAVEVLSNYGVEVYSIRARSPDLNPIENLFNLVSMKLEKEVKEKNITCETFAEFSLRVKNMLVNFSIAEINKLIGNYLNRIQAVIKCKGGRTKY